MKPIGLDNGDGYGDGNGFGNSLGDGTIELRR